MKKFLLAMTAVGALAVAAPASAQYVNANAGGTVGISNQISQLEARLQADIQARRLTRTEAVELQRDLTQLRRLHSQYSRNGLTRDEQANLHGRIRNFQQQLHVAGGYGRGSEDQYANTNAGGTVGISNQIAHLQTRIQADVQAGRLTRTEAARLNNDLRQLQRLQFQYTRNGLTRQEHAELLRRVQLLQRDLRVAGGSNIRYDRYGNPVNDYYGRGGPYEDQYDYNRNVDCDRPGGIAGVIGSIFGGNRDDCTAQELRVGQRVSTGLYGVPTQYRTRFRDGGGVYYRSDGRNIYQIDARTQTVIRVYDID